MAFFEMNSFSFIKMKILNEVSEVRVNSNLSVTVCILEPSVIPYRTIAHDPKG